jgi:membrane protease YdiL (CAAX protease family)
MRRSFLERQPIAASVLIFIAAKVWFIIATVLPTSTIGRWSPVAGSAAVVLVGAVAPLVLVYRFLQQKGWAHLVGFTPARKWHALWLAWLPALYVLVNFINLAGNATTMPLSGDAMRMILTQTASVPVFEETVFRGLILATLLNRYHASRGEILKAVMIGAVLFGCWHLPMPNNPDVWQQSAARVVYTFFWGVCWAALVVRTRSIWIGMIVHALILASNLLVSTLTVGEAVPLSQTVAAAAASRSAAFTVLATVPLLLYGLYLLKDVRGIGGEDAESESSLYLPKR